MNSDEISAANEIWAVDNARSVYGEYHPEARQDGMTREQYDLLFYDMWVNENTPGYRDTDGELAEYWFTYAVGDEYAMDLEEFLEKYGESV